MKKFILFLGVIFFVSPFYVFSQKGENFISGFSGGLNFGSLVNSEFDDYYKYNPGIGLNLTSFYGLKSNALNRMVYFGFEAKNSSFVYRYNTSTNAIVNQTKIGLTLSGDVYRYKADIPLEIIVGAEIYTLDQRRLPDPTSGLNGINDGFGAYWGVAFNAGLIYKFDFGKMPFGISYNVSFYPNLTFLNKNDVPEFYSVETSISMVFMLKGKGKEKE